MVSVIPARALAFPLQSCDSVSDGEGAGLNRKLRQLRQIYSPAYGCQVGNTLKIDIHLLCVKTIVLEVGPDPAVYLRVLEIGPLIVPQALYCTT